MAALVVVDGFDLDAFRRALVARLPHYARPVLVRIVPAIELTGTFKLRKQDLVAQGYDPAKVRDALYVDDAARGAYVPFDAALHRSLHAGQLRL